MSDTKNALLDDRGVVRVTGEEATPFLDNLVTNDLEGMADGEARFAALLSPQGKILFDFFVVRTADGYLLDIARDKAAELVKRLTLYKLRAKVEFVHLEGIARVFARWQRECILPEPVQLFDDPRRHELGERAIWQSDLIRHPVHHPAWTGENVAAYHAHRIALGIPEGGKDYIFGDTFPHEADMDRLHGVSFTKGCFVGQEVVARMQHKTVVRKRIVHVQAAAPLTSGAEVNAGDAVIGSIGSVSGSQGLAMLRLDRAIEAIDKGEAITTAGQSIAIDSIALTSYRTEAARKAEEKAARI